MHIKKQDSVFSNTLSFLFDDVLVAKRVPRKKYRENGCVKTTLDDAPIDGASRPLEPID